MCLQEHEDQELKDALFSDAGKKLMSKLSPVGAAILQHGHFYSLKFLARKGKAAGSMAKEVVAHIHDGIGCSFRQSQIMELEASWVELEGVVRKEINKPGVEGHL